LCELKAKILDHPLKGVRFVKELSALGEQDEAEQTTHPRGVLSLWSLEISGVEGLNIGDGSIVLGVIHETAQQFGQRSGETETKLGDDAHRFVGLGNSAGLAKIDGFIKDYAHHAVERFEVLGVGVEDLGFSDGKPSTPIMADR
jgi:hypothetical protein